MYNKRLNFLDTYQSKWDRMSPMEKIKDLKKGIKDFEAKLCYATEGGKKVILSLIADYEESIKYWSEEL